MVIEAAGQRGRHRERDRTLLLLMFRHGLRPGEAASLKWDAIMIDKRVIHINRLKGSQSGNHPLQPDRVEALLRLKALYPNGYHMSILERNRAA